MERLHARGNLSSIVMLAISTLINLAACLIPLQDPLTIPLTYEVVRNGDVHTYFDKAQFFMTYDSIAQESPKNPSFFPDLSASMIITNEECSPANWGIVCTKETNTTKVPDPRDNCLANENTTNSTYRRVNMTYSNSTTFFFLRNSRLENTQLVNAVPFYLGKKLTTPPWPYADTGVLGLSPSQANPLWGYLFRTYSFTGNRFVYSFNYKPGDLMDRFNPWSTRAFGQSSLTVNGYNKDVASNKGFYIVSQDRSFDVWTFPFVNITLVNPADSKETEIITGKACLTNDYHDFFAAEPDIVEMFKKTVAQAMCDKDNCGGTLDYDKAPIMHVNIQLSDGDTVRYVLNPESFVFSDSSTRVSAGNLSEWRKDACPGDFSVGFGKLFFMAAFITFEVDKNENKKISLTEYVKFARTNSMDKLILLGFIVTSVFVLIVFAAYKISKTRQEMVYDSHSVMSGATDSYKSMAAYPDTTQRDDIPS
jgi:hypothetical protein